MELFSTLAQLREFGHRAHADRKRLGLVPTMGALHAGHRSLIERSVAECDRTVVSVFVNPLQFAPHEDLTKYPRPIERDLELAEAAGADAVFNPSVEEMYPDGALLTSVRVVELSTVLEGASRPGHFDGVTTVVSKLLSLVGECHAYFGEKDWQQLTIVRQMVRDLSLDATIIGCSTVREPDGLALSSRNIYLDKEQRTAALALSDALRLAVGADDSASAARERLEREPLCELDYALVVDSRLRPTLSLSGDARMVVAARVGTTRLLDNCGPTGL